MYNQIFFLPDVISDEKIKKNSKWPVFVHSVKIFANGTKAENCTINCINNCNNEQYNEKLNKTKPGKYKQWILFSVWSAHKLGTKPTSTKVAKHLN